MSILSNNFLTNRSDYITLWNVKVIITPLNGDIRGRKKSWSGMGWGDRFGPVGWLEE
jgi:hypothetical protein